MISLAGAGRHLYGLDDTGQVFRLEIALDGDGKVVRRYWIPISMEVVE